MSKLNILNSFLPQEKVKVLDDIGEILEPENVSFSFDTIGWKYLFALFFFTIITSSILFIKNYIKNTYRRKALKELNKLKATKQTNSAIVNNANLLLKKITIQIYGRNETANLYGKEWVIFLDSKTKNIDNRNIEKIFSKASYMSEELNLEERNTVVAFTKKWIETHA